MRSLHEPDKRTKHPLGSFLAVVVFFQAMGGLMGWITAHGVDDWYRTLQRSPLTPPDPAFGIVWSILYLLLAISFWRLWKSPDTNQKRFTLVLFVSHMILNWLWTPLFFIAHALGASVLAILVMIFSASMLAWLLWPQDKRAAMIFAPYLAWLLFAAHLSHFIWKFN
jgi:tryptophan-rich sensory protein